jgi:hypothetical protein
VEIAAVSMRGPGGPTHAFTPGDRVEIEFHVRAKQAVSDFVFGVAMFNADGICCYGTNTQIEGGQPTELRGDATVRFTIDSLDLVDGSYTIDVAVHRESGAPYDYQRKLHPFRVTSGIKDIGICRPRHRWQFEGGVAIRGLE